MAVLDSLGIDSKIDLIQSNDEEGDFELEDGQTIEEYLHNLFWKNRVLLSLPFLMLESAYTLYIGYSHVKKTTFLQS